MKKYLILSLLFIISLSGYSQLKFEAGYFIDNNGNKTECLIRNIDWLYNPTKFDYKLNKEDEVQSNTISTIKEFGVYDFSKYIRKNILLNISKNEIDKLTIHKDPEFIEKRVFLNVLIEGEANLYSYVRSNQMHYFYSLNQSNINPLIYKRYLYSLNKISENNYYKQQIWSQLKCPNILQEDAVKTKYNKTDLIKYFTVYNNYFETESFNYDGKQNTDEKMDSSAIHVNINYVEKKDRSSYSLSIRPGLSYTSIIVQNNITNSEAIDFGTTVGYKIGIENEFGLPYNKNKWAFIFEPTYHNYKAEKASNNINYQALEFTFGMRHYFVISDNSKLFITGSYNLNVPLHSKIDFLTGSDVDLQIVKHFAVGCGYSLKNRLNFEIIYGFNHNFVPLNYYWNSSFKSFSIVLGYRLVNI